MDPDRRQIIDRICCYCTSSASLSSGWMPVLGRGGDTHGACFKRSSVFTNSTVARVSRSLSNPKPTFTGPARAAFLQEMKDGKFGLRRGLDNVPPVG